MKAIVGLGNPGPRYRNTRHNVGWQVVDYLAERWRAGKAEKARHSEVRRCSVEGEVVLLVRPLTFMNDSGKAVRALVEKDKLAARDILVVYDDLDLQFGRIRVRATGSSGGHNGIRSIQQHLGQIAGASRGASRGAGARGLVTALKTALTGAPRGAAGSADATEGATDAAAEDPTAFPRIKVGIGRPPGGVDPIDHVLAPFTPDERQVIEEAVGRAADAAQVWLGDGVTAAMNRFNST